MRSEEELLELVRRFHACNTQLSKGGAEHPMDVIGSCTGEELCRIRTLEMQEYEHYLALMEAVAAEERRQKKAKRNPRARLQLTRAGQRDPVLLEALLRYQKEKGH